MRLGLLELGITFMVVVFLVSGVIRTGSRKQPDGPVFSGAFFVGLAVIVGVFLLLAGLTSLLL